MSESQLSRRDLLRRGLTASLGAVLPQYPLSTYADVPSAALSGLAAEYDKYDALGLAQLIANKQFTPLELLGGDLDKLYADESHCLVSPEIRSDKDNPISCFCRDAIADARYLYFTQKRVSQ